MPTELNICPRCVRTFPTANGRLQHLRWHLRQDSFKRAARAGQEGKAQ